MLNTPFSPWPSFTDEEAEAASSVLRSNRVNYWTGSEGKEFEREFADWVGVRHAVALANGTLALDLIVRALGLGPGDEVVVTPRTFIASVSCVAGAGATPVFADVDAESGNMTADTIRAVLTPKTRAIICVHLAGWPCEMDEIMRLAEEHDFTVVEDCAQAHGARFGGRSVGSIGHVAAWSFCQDKIMSLGGEGGMVTTDDADLYSRIWSLKDHGKNPGSVAAGGGAGFRWLHDSFGTNARMLEIQSALGRIQLRRMPGWSTGRRRNASELAAALQPVSGPDGVVRVPQLACAHSAGPAGSNLDGDCCANAFYRMYAYINPSRLADGWTRDRVVQEIIAQGVPCYTGCCPEVYLEKAFDGTGWRPAHRLPTARTLGEVSLMWLVHPTLTSAEIGKAGVVSRSVLERAWKR